VKGAHDARAVVDRMRAIDPSVEPRKSQSRGNHKSSELIYIDVDEPTFSPSMPGGIPLVPPPADPPRLAQIQRDHNPPDIASPVIGAPSVPGVGGPALTLASAIDPDIYSVEEASSIFAGSVEGFTSTQLDAPVPGPLDGWGTARIITPDQLPGAGTEDREEDAAADVRDASRDVVEEPAGEAPEEWVEEVPERVGGDDREIVEDERDDEDSYGPADDVDPEAELRAAIEEENATSRATPVAVAEVEEPPGPTLDGSMKELLGDVVIPSAPAPSGSRRASIPSPVLCQLCQFLPSKPRHRLRTRRCPTPTTERRRGGGVLRRSALAAGERGLDVALAASPATDAPVIEPAVGGANPNRSRRGAHPSRFRILLADALEASSVPTRANSAARSMRGSTSRSRSRRRRIRRSPRSPRNPSKPSGPP
jgi:hypothetical protein